MNAFVLNGYDENKIQLTIDEFIGFPNQTDINGGYTFKGTLEIVSDVYMVKKQDVYSATGALYTFSDALKLCYNTLKGSAEYTVIYENDFTFTVSMETGGRAIIKGFFKSRSDVENILHFEIPTDQSCFLSVINDINALKKTYGGMQGLWGLNCIRDSLPF